MWNATNENREKRILHPILHQLSKFGMIKNHFQVMLSLPLPLVVAKWWPPIKICPSLSLEPMNVGKVFADVVKDLEKRSSWIFRVKSKSNDK